MSNVSIFETRWIELVFAEKNKAYGAYQLRLENPKTTLKSLFIATTLFALAVASPMIFNSGKKSIADGGVIATPLELSDVFYPPKQDPEKTDVLPPAKKEEPKKETDKQNLVSPDVVEANKAKGDIATNEEAATNPNEGSTEGTGTTVSGTEGGTESGSGTTNGEGLGEEPTGPYVEGTLDVRPAFPGGMEHFYNYVSKNFKTPEMDVEKTIRVYVSFVIEKDGSMTNIRVPRNPGYGLDREAIRVLKSLKVKWTPGMIKGRPVRTAYNLPISVVTK